MAKNPVQRSTTLPPRKRADDTGNETDLAAIKELEAAASEESKSSDRDSASSSGEQPAELRGLESQKPESLKGQRFRKKHLILTLDGGGLHGVVSGTILYRVEHILKRLLLERFYQKYGPDSPERNPAKLKHYYLITMRDLRLSDVVDTIAGTSTGAIMAGYLAAQAARAGHFESDVQYSSNKKILQELDKPFSDGRVFKDCGSVNLSDCKDKSVQDEIVRIFNESFGFGRYKTSQLVELYTRLSAKAFVNNKKEPILGENMGFLKKMALNTLFYWVPGFKIFFRPKYDSVSMNEMLKGFFGDTLKLSDIAQSPHWSGALILTAFSVDRGVPVLIIGEGSYKVGHKEQIKPEQPIVVPLENFQGIVAADPFQWTQLYTETYSRNVHIASEDKDRESPFQGKYSIGATRFGNYMEADFPLWEALRSSSAFPIYYAPHKLSVKPKGDPNDGFLLADGGLFGNDPTVPAILYTLFTKEYFLSETPPKAPGNLLSSLLGNMELAAEINVSQLFYNAGLMDNYMRIKFNLDKNSETGKLFQQTTFSLGSNPDHSMATLIQIGHGVVDRYEGIVGDWRQDIREPDQNKNAGDEQAHSQNEPLITKFLKNNFFQDDGLLEFIEQKFPMKNSEQILNRMATKT